MPPGTARMAQPRLREALVAPTAAERTCIQPGHESFAQACGACILYQDAGQCDILSSAQREQAANARNERKTWDTVIPNWRTLQGMRDLAELNETTRQNLQNRTCSIEIIDIRGLHAINELFGRPTGDKMLTESAGRHIGIRAVGKSRDPDLGFRGTGSDELCVLRQGIDHKNANLVATRTALKFSPDTAKNDCREGRPPIMATVSYAHAEELELPSTATPEEIFDALQRLAFERHETLKDAQYDLLWSQVVGHSYRGNETPPPRPEDPRLIVGPWWELFCPGYADLFRRMDTAR